MNYTQLPLLLLLAGACDLSDTPSTPPASECVADSDCSNAFCGWAADNSRICKPWADLGDSCGGNPAPENRAFCASDLDCVDGGGATQGLCAEPSLFLAERMAQGLCDERKFADEQCMHPSIDTCPSTFNYNQCFLDEVNRYEAAIDTTSAAERVALSTTIGDCTRALHTLDCDDMAIPLTDGSPANIIICVYYDPQATECDAIDQVIGL